MLTVTTLLRFLRPRGYLSSAYTNEAGTCGGSESSRRRSRPTAEFEFLESTSKMSVGMGPCSDDLHGGRAPLKCEEFN